MMRGAQLLLYDVFLPDSDVLESDYDSGSEVDGEIVETDSVDYGVSDQVSIDFEGMRYNRVLSTVDRESIKFHTRQMAVTFLKPILVRVAHNVIESLSKAERLDEIKSEIINQLNEGGSFTSSGLGIGVLARGTTYVVASYSVNGKLLHSMIDNFFALIDEDALQAFIAKTNNEQQNLLLEIIGRALELLIEAAAQYNAPADFIRLVEDQQFQQLLNSIQTAIQAALLWAKQNSWEVSSKLLPTNPKLAWALWSYFRCNVQDESFNKLTATILQHTFSAHNMIFCPVSTDAEYCAYDFKDIDRNAMTNSLSQLVIAFKPIMQQAILNRITENSVGSILDEFIKLFTPIEFAREIQIKLAKRLFNAPVMQEIIRGVMDLITQENIYEQLQARDITKQDLIHFAALFELGMGRSLAAKLHVAYTTDKATQWRACWALQTLEKYLADLIIQNRQQVIDLMVPYLTHSSIKKRLVKSYLHAAFCDENIRLLVSRIFKDFLHETHPDYANFSSALESFNMTLAEVIDTRRGRYRLRDGFTQLTTEATRLNTTLNADIAALPSDLTHELTRLQQIREVTTAIESSQESMRADISSGELVRYKKLAKTLQSYQERLKGYVAYKNQSLAKMDPPLNWWHTLMMLFASDQGAYQKQQYEVFKKRQKQEVEKKEIAEALLKSVTPIYQQVKDAATCHTHNGFANRAELERQLGKFCTNAHATLQTMPSRNWSALLTRDPRVVRHTRKCMEKIERKDLVSRFSRLQAH